LIWGEIELVRTDIFSPALVGLLPERPVRPGDRWQATTAALQELTDLERIDEAGMTCTFDSVTTVNNRRHARILLSGSVRGLGEDGAGRHQLEGFILFDLESNHLSYLSLKGVHTLVDPSGKESGKIEGTFVLTRQPGETPQEISEAGLRGVSL